VGNSPAGAGDFGAPDAEHAGGVSPEENGAGVGGLVASADRDKKLAYADRAKYYADPEFASVPTKELISKAYSGQAARG